MMITLTNEKARLSMTRHLGDVSFKLNAPPKTSIFLCFLFLSLTKKKITIMASSSSDLSDWQSEFDSISSKLSKNFIYNEINTKI
jgi:hypothetical protein